MALVWILGSGIDSVGRNLKQFGSDAMWVITEVLADCNFGQTSEVSKTSEV